MGVAKPGPARWFQNGPLCPRRHVQKAWPRGGAGPRCGLLEQAVQPQALGGTTQGTRSATGVSCKLIHHCSSLHTSPRSDNTRGGTRGPVGVGGASALRTHLVDGEGGGGRHSRTRRFEARVV